MDEGNVVLRTKINRDNPVNDRPKGKQEEIVVVEPEVGVGGNEGEKINKDEMEEKNDNDGIKFPEDDVLVEEVVQNDINKENVNEENNLENKEERIIQKYENEREKLIKNGKKEKKKHAKKPVGKQKEGESTSDGKGCCCGCCCECCKCKHCLII